MGWPFRVLGSGLLRVDPLSLGALLIFADPRRGPIGSFKGLLGGFEVL